MTTATERLATELMNSHAPKELIAEVLRYQYHDFKSPLGAPKMALVGRLQGEGLDDIALRVRTGEFDD